MKEEVKLILALQQVDNLTELLQGNQYQDYFYARLISMQAELQRQLTNLKSSSKL